MKTNIISFSSIEQLTSMVTPKLPVLYSKLAHGLILKVHIEPGMSLVTIFGKGAKKSKHEALAVNVEMYNDHAPEQLELDFGDEHTFNKGT